MKFIKSIFIALFAIVMFSNDSFGQMVGTNAYLFGTDIEIGIHADGYPGSSPGLPPFPTHYRGFTNRISFLCNPDASAIWDDITDPTEGYSGDFYMPGSPENRIGMEVGGTTVWNSSATGAPGITPTSLGGYAITGKCKSVDWAGSYSGIDVDLTYIIDSTERYYRMAVTLTNTTAVTENDVYFYYAADPDNNQDIGWGFGTTNTIEAQPTPFCPKSLVTATSTMGWESYLGYGAIDANTRVGRGSFFVTDASDIYDGTGAIIGTVGSTAFADQAISICHRVATLAPGASESFEFVVVMSEDAIEEALKAQYFLDYDGAPGSLDICIDPTNDTVEFDCAGTVTLSIDGPELGAYTWTWTDESGMIVGTGPTIDITPAGTETYTVTGVPIGGCFVSNIVREIVAVGVGVAPEIDITDIGPQCSDVPLSDLIITDIAGIPGTVTEFYSVPPDSLGDPDDIYTGPIMPGDVVYVVIGDPVGGCFDIEEIIIDFITINAGLDSTGFALCNSGLETVDLNTMLVDTILGMAGFSWEETTMPASGGFNPLTGIFDPTGVPAGDYTFDFIALGGGLCDNDTSTMTITVYDQPEAGIDGVGNVCNNPGALFDVNTLLSGHDLGGFWEEITPTGGAFDVTTGILNLDGTLAAGDYDFQYIVTGTAPCINDTSIFTITVNALPMVVAGADQSICVGDGTTVSASGTPGTIFTWDVPGVVNGLSFTPPVGTVTYTVTGTSTAGCVASDSLVIVVHALPVVNFSASDVDGCTDFETDFTVTADQVIASTDWTFGDGDVIIGSTTPTVTHTYLFGGTYDVGITVTDEFGCVNTLSFSDYILVEDHPVAAFTFSPQSVFTNDTEGDVFYPVQLTASNYLGCMDVITRFLEVREIILFYVPNTFTPDGDQFNELFRPVFESGFDPFNFHMTIFNRYGEIVFESFDATGGWDGAFGNKGLAEDGVYTWKIDFKELHSDKRHEEFGSVLLLK